MGMLAARVIGSAGSAVDNDFVACMVIVAHTEVDTGFDTDWAGNA